MILPSSIFISALSMVLDGLGFTASTSCSVRLRLASRPTAWVKNVPLDMSCVPSPSTGRGLPCWKLKMQKNNAKSRTQAGGRRRSRCGLLEGKVRICCGPLRSSITEPCSALRICYGPLLGANVHQPRTNLLAAAKITFRLRPH